MFRESSEGGPGDTLVINYLVMGAAGFEPATSRV